MSVTNVRTRGTNRARMSAREPYFSKKAWVFVTYTGLNSFRPTQLVRGLNSGGPITYPIQ
jgi:hypothetical protein